MKEALAGMLLPDFVTGLHLEENTAAATTRVSGVLHFESQPDPAKVAAHLALLAQLETAAAGADGVSFQGLMTGTGLDEKVVSQRLKLALEPLTLSHTYTCCSITGVPGSGVIPKSTPVSVR